MGVSDLAFRTSYEPAGRHDACDGWMASNSWWSGPGSINQRHEIPIVVVAAKYITDTDRGRLGGDGVGLIEKGGLDRVAPPLAVWRRYVRGSASLVASGLLLFSTSALVADDDIQFWPVLTLNHAINHRWGGPGYDKGQVESQISPPRFSAFAPYTEARELAVSPCATMLSTMVHVTVARIVSLPGR
jgi:hypothetical protein